MRQVSSVNFSPLLLLIAVVALVGGFLGTLYFDSWVAPHLDIFICCIPSGIIAFIFLMLALVSGLARVQKSRTVSFNMDGTAPQNWQDPGYKSLKFDQMDRAELKNRRQNMKNFLEKLEDQKKDGSISPQMYMQLKSRYEKQLSDIEFFLGKDDR